MAGLGFVAVRDTASWLKHAADAVAPAKYAYAFGSSQSGRFLRNFLYEGFNTDERNRQVFDAVMAHIAGAARIDLNRRWATPTALGAVHGDVVSLRRFQTARSRDRGRRRRARQPARARSSAEDLLHEHRRGVLGRRTLGGADSHGARRRAGISRCRTTSASIS